jgi:hypothetical protein
MKEKIIGVIDDVKAHGMDAKILDMRTSGIKPFVSFIINKNTVITGEPGRTDIVEVAWFRSGDLLVASSVVKLKEKPGFKPPFEAILYGPTNFPYWMVVDSQGEEFCRYSSTLPTVEVPNMVKVTVATMNEKYPVPDLTLTKTLVKALEHAVKWMTDPTITDWLNRSGVLGDYGKVVIQAGAALAEAEKEAVTRPSEIDDGDPATDEEIQTAREMYGTEEINIDEGAKTSRGDDGVWVAAWVLIPNEGESKEVSASDVETVLSGHGYAGCEEYAEQLFSELDMERITEAASLFTDSDNLPDLIFSEIEDILIEKGILTGGKIFPHP